MYFIFITYFLALSNYFDFSLSILGLHMCACHSIDDEAKEQRKKKVGAGAKEKNNQGMLELQRDLILSNKDDHGKKTKRVFKRIIRTKKADGTVTSREVIITDPKEVWTIKYLFVVDDCVFQYGNW